MVVKVGQIKDPVSWRNGMWYVAVSEGRGKPFRIVYTDMYRTVCVKYAKLLKETPPEDGGK